MFHKPLPELPSQAVVDGSPLLCMILRDNTGLQHCTYSCQQLNLKIWDSRSTVMLGAKERDAEGMRGGEWRGVALP